MGNPDENSRNTVTTGKITSREPVPFGDKDGETQHNIIEHTAKTSSGSSGGALLNKDMEIVGIHLGGSENIFRSFLRGKAMPCDRMLDFLSDMDLRLTNTHFR
jgi:S1-C subfamily serine protease